MAQNEQQGSTTTTTVSLDKNGELEIVAGVHDLDVFHFNYTRLKATCRNTSDIEIAAARYREIRQYGAPAERSMRIIITAAHSQEDHLNALLPFIQHDYYQRYVEQRTYSTRYVFHYRPGKALPLAKKNTTLKDEFSSCIAYIVNEAHQDVARGSDRARTYWRTELDCLVTERANYFRRCRVPELWYYDLLEDMEVEERLIKEAGATARPCAEVPWFEE